MSGIEGIPVIIRFKTPSLVDLDSSFKGIEGIPVIIRFKTLMKELPLDLVYHLVLKVF